MSNKLIVYHNDVNSVAFRSFNSVEHDIFDALVYNFREKGEEEITFNFHYLKELINYNDNTSTNFPKLVDSMYDKLLNCKIKIGNEMRWTKFTLFTKYTIDLTTQTVTAKVNTEFAYILNNLQANFTQYELMNSLNLRSTYSKVFYKHMMQYKTTGIWKIEIEEFRRLMDIPEKYSVSDIDRWVLTPILKEINELKTDKDELYHYNLKVKKIYEVVGRGRPRVSAFEFKFRKELSKSQIEQIANGLKPKYELNKDTKQPKKHKIYNLKIDEDKIDMWDKYFKNNKTTLEIVAPDGNRNVVFITGVRILLNGKIGLFTQNAYNFYQLKPFEFMSIDKMFDDFIDKFKISGN
jgi:plasmid replication initiation protein